MNIINAFDKTYIFPMDGAEFEISDGMIRVFNRSQRHHSVAVDLIKLFGKREAYRSSAQIKLAENSIPKTMYIVHKITIEYIGLKYTMYEIGDALNVTDSAWVTLSKKDDIPPEANLIEFVSYIFQSESTDFPDLYIKDYSAEIAEAEKNVTVERNTLPLNRQDKLTVGVIRWDAYHKTGTPSSFVSDQVARALSPKKYHHMAPFFADITDDKIVFAEATQERFDREAELAISAGIDYFAYCVYRNSDPMSYARKQHLSSKYKNKIKMSFILGASKADDETLVSVANAVMDECYLRFDGRPVIYIYDAFKMDMSVLQKLETLLNEKGETKPPYYIGMLSQASPHMINTLIKKGINAMGAYGYGPVSEGEAYASLAKRTEEINAVKYAYSGSIDIVPLINCGRDTRPRLDTPVSWASGYAGRYSIQATSKELYLHTSNVLKDIKNAPEKNIPNTALIYAWNEHDEGGWCCPTLLCDENGLPILDENGNKRISTEYLDAIKRAIIENK